MARAYGELERLGGVVTEGARGTRVAERRQNPLPEAERPDTLAGLLRAVAAAAFQLGATATALGMQYPERELRAQRLSGRASDRRVRGCAAGLHRNMGGLRMNGYDWDFGFGFGRRHSAHRGGGGYGAEFQRGYDRFYGRGRRGGFAQGGWSEGGRSFGGRAGGGVQRGGYGEDYPTFGGFPGGRRQGMYYGGQSRGRTGGYDRQVGMGHGGGYDRGWDRGGTGYDAGFAREPFLPEAAYQRHPELNRQQRRGGERWPSQGHDEAHHVQRSDDEIERAVRENLYGDNWVDADRIDVSVENGVVTLQGEVADYLEARYAWDDAWEAQGVRGVINQITVRTDLPADEPAVSSQTSGSRGSEGTT